jgi:hypothetical protein
MPSPRRRVKVYIPEPSVSSDARLAAARDYFALRARMAADPDASLTIRRAQVDGDTVTLERLLIAAAARGWTTWPPPARWLEPVRAQAGGGAR